MTAFGISLVCDLWYKYAQTLAYVFREGGWMSLQVEPSLILAVLMKLNFVQNVTWGTGLEWNDLY